MIQINIIIKENLWIISIVAGILGVLTLFTPAWGDISGIEIELGWLWNLFVEGSYVGLIPLDEPIATFGILTTIMIIIGTSLLLLGGILKKLKDREINLLYLIGGILPLIAIIIYMVGVAVEYEGWWSYYTVSAGSILPFIAGGLGIAAGVFGLMQGRKA
ncbi:MAG: hypothetical protein ACFE9Z_01020 [Promethearchaeota archaeon]